MLHSLGVTTSLTKYEPPIGNVEVSFLVLVLVVRRTAYTLCNVLW